ASHFYDIFPNCTEHHRSPFPSQAYHDLCCCCEKDPMKWPINPNTGLQDHVFPYRHLLRSVPRFVKWDHLVDASLKNNRKCIHPCSDCIQLQACRRELHSSFVPLSLPLQKAHK